MRFDEKEPEVKEIPSRLVVVWPKEQIVQPTKQVIQPKPKEIAKPVPILKRCKYVDASTDP